MKQQFTIGVYIVLIVLMGCERKEPLPLTDFYSFADISRISIRANRTDYYIGVDSLLVPAISALDSISRTKLLPDSAYAYFLNGQRVVSNRFVFTKPGSQTITAQFGTKKSNDLIINAVEPVIALTIERTDYYIGIDTTFIVLAQALDLNQHSLPVSANAFSFFLNDLPVKGNRFSFTKTGLQTIQAQLRQNQKRSNSLIINALDPAVAIQSIKLSLDKSSGVPFLTADGKSRLRFQTAVAGSDGKEIPINVNTQLRANGQSLPTNHFFQTHIAGNYQITATAYGKESNAIAVQARPVETYSVVKIPVIFHFVNTNPYEGSYHDLLKATTAYYRNTSEPLAKSDNPAGVDEFIEFEPAFNDPSGKPLPKAGEHIITNGPTEYKSGEMVDAAFQNYYWNPNAYLNVFVFNCATCADEGAAGFAVGMPPSASDGWARNTTPTFAYATYVDNKPGYLNPGLLAHEFGHMLNLPHTFNGNGTYDASDPCAQDSDNCEDTPLYARRQQPPDVELYEGVSCSGQRFFSTNPMAYFGFSVNFTYNQRQRMRNQIEYGLWLPTPKNQGIGGGRLAASAQKATNQTLPKPVIIFCHAQ